jgi:MFS family permease
MNESPRKTPWHFGLSAYWFATSLKWFLLFFLTPAMVNKLVPGGEQNRSWGLIFAAGAMVSIVGPAVIGWLSDRTPTPWGRRRPYVAVGAVITAISVLLLGKAESFGALMVAYLLVQLGDAVGTGPYASTIPELVEEEERGRASGSMGLLQLVGQVVAVAIGMILKSDPRMIFISIAAVNLVCAVFSIIAIYRLEKGKVLTVKAAEPIKFRSLLEPLRDADFRWAWGTRFLNALGFYIVLNYLLNFLKDVVKTYDLGIIRFGDPLEATIAMAALLSITGAVSSVIYGKRADVVGRKKVVIEAGWIMFVAMALFCFLSNYMLVAPLALIFGVGYGAYLSADWALVSDVIPDKENPARDMGVWHASVVMPQVLSGLIGGVIDWGNGLGGWWGYRIAFFLGSIALLMGSVLVKKIRGST